MIESLKNIDQSLFLFLNGLHSPFFDTLFYWTTKTLVWLPFYLVLFWLVIRQYSWQTLLILVFAALLILVSDQLCNIFKESVHRLRPSNDPSLSVVHIVNEYKGGMYGFYSSHASNTFAVAVFLTLLTGSRYRFIPWLVFIWAAIMSYSRIYLGVHYPGDTLAGMVMGLLMGYLAGGLCLRTLEILREKRSKKN
jgi:undecaprenyl-diphosphatase